MRKKPALIVFFIIVTLALLGFVPLRVLEIISLKSGRTVFVHMVNKGDRFSVSYIHSVELSRVKDSFVINDGYKIALYETLYQSGNAGLPHMLEGKETLKRDAEGFRISNMNRIWASVDMWVNEDYENTLEIMDKVIWLPSLSGNTLLRLQIRKITLWKYIRFSFINRLISVSG